MPRPALPTLPPVPTQLDPARDYFQTQAQTYTDGSGRGLWRLFRRWETATVLVLAQPRPGETILDAGSGSGHYTAALCQTGAAVTALDGAPAMLAALRDRLHVQTIEADLMTVRLEPVFDQVVCAGVLEFVPDPAMVLANLRTGLRTDGPRRITILVPFRWTGGRFYRRFHRRHGVAVHLFSRGDLDRLAAGIGMRVGATRRATFNIVARLEPTAQQP